MAIIVTRALGLADPRTVGSGNPGATNVLRYGGKKAAILTLLGDLGKGALAVLLARWLTTDTMVLALCGLGAFLGHLYPIFFGFRGGKGVATGLGVWLALWWPVGVMLLLTWFVVAYLFRYSSLAALVAAVLLPLYVAWFVPVAGFMVLSVAMTVLLLWRHRSNITKLMDGTEGKIGRPKDKTAN